MIINLHIILNILRGALVALLVLVSLSLFFVFVREMDDIGKGDYGLLRVVEYVVLRIPGKIVEFMPLAVLLGSMLGLGALASNSEIIAMQAAGLSLGRMLSAVIQAALMIAVLSFVLSDWVVPTSETSAKNLRNVAQKKASKLSAKRGLWIKDDNRILHIKLLMPNGSARNIEIYELGENGQLAATIHAKTAIPNSSGWLLRNVKKTVLDDKSAKSTQMKQMLYSGNISHELLEVLMIEPRQMSTSSLSAYLSFLDENKLDAKVERLIFWQRVFAPLTIIVMTLLAFPFVLGAQRQANTGQRLMLGILLGLGFVVLERLLTQLGSRWSMNEVLLALLPNLIFFALVMYLLMRKLSHRKMAPG